MRVCQHYSGEIGLNKLHALDVGSSSGIIDNYLADSFGQVTGIDIDAAAMEYARTQFQKANLTFLPGDAMQLQFADNSIDVVVCTQIYEHVPDADRMFAEILRVLKPGGFCYFAGNTRLMFMEPHYHLPLLSVIPRPLAHRYMRMAGKGSFYHEKHFTYWTLKRKCQGFQIVDYSAAVIIDPEAFGVSYMLPPGSLKWRLANAVARATPWAAPIIWILRKPPALTT
ncbi:MAG: class I SAM-dependent methyltransferase [Pseudomonadota bacterium]